MAYLEGFLDYGSGRYKLMGRAGQEDSYLHAGDWLEVWSDRGWVAVQVLADLLGRWYFVDGNGLFVTVPLGMRARMVNQWQAL